MSPEQIAAAWEQYKEQRAAQSRRRRTRIRFSQFTVLSKIGQGGYGQVFLTRKTDTSEVCAVKRMAKAALARRGAVRLPPAAVHDAHVCSLLCRGVFQRGDRLPARASAS